MSVEWTRAWSIFPLINNLNVIIKPIQKKYNKTGSEVKIVDDRNYIFLPIAISLCRCQIKQT